MSVITTWLAGKGLDFSERVLHDSLKLSGPTFNLEERIQDIGTKLDALIKAPYKQAVMHLRADQLEKCEDKLIEAISLDEFDLPARLLYIDILRHRGRYDLALDYYLDLVGAFGLRYDLVPQAILEAYILHRAQLKVVHPTFPGFSVERNRKWILFELSWSLGGVMMRWRKSTFWAGPDSYEAYRWTGDRIFRISGWHAARLYDFTDRFAVFKLDKDKFSIWRLVDGSRVARSFSDAEVTELFFDLTSRDVNVQHPALQDPTFQEQLTYSLSCFEGDYPAFSLAFANARLTRIREEGKRTLFRVSAGETTSCTQN